MASKHLITLAEAEEMTKTYRALRERIIDISYRGKDALPICETFDRDAFDDILAQNGCVSVRLYLGMDNTQKVKVIAVGVNAQDEDMLPNTDPEIMERGQRCPTICPPASSLNS